MLSCPGNFDSCRSPTCASLAVMKRLILLLLALTSLVSAVEPLTLTLWPEGAPGKMLPHSKFTEDFIRTKAGKSTVTDITDPTIVVYRPERPNGTSVIVAPGGGFVFLSAVHEGTQVCEWLNSIGVTEMKFRDTNLIALVVTLIQ